MTWENYLQYFEKVIAQTQPEPPYDREGFLQYTKMNWVRFSRWLKNNPLTDFTKNAIASINQKQRWVVIAEPWCGDAAHIVPVIYLMSKENPDNIELDFQLRDSGSEIDNYLTNGTKSIPILIVRDTEGNDLFHWGPRPQEAMSLFKDLKEKNIPLDDIKTAVHVFYNKDKAKGTQEEIVSLIKK